MRFVLDILVRAGLIWAFIYLGLLSVHTEGRPIHGFLEYLLVAILGTLILLIVQLLVIGISAIVVGIISAISKEASNIIVVIVVLVFGFASNCAALWAAALLFPNNIFLSGFWSTILCGFLLTAVARLLGSSKNNS